jgi:hypothetical protein
MRVAQPELEQQQPSHAERFGIPATRLITKFFGPASFMPRRGATRDRSSREHRL